MLNSKFYELMVLEMLIEIFTNILPVLLIFNLEREAKNIIKSSPPPPTTVTVPP